MRVILRGRYDNLSGNNNQIHYTLSEDHTTRSNMYDLYSRIYRLNTIRTTRVENTVIFVSVKTFFTNEKHHVHKYTCCNYTSGTQRVISFLRQIVEHGGFYRTSDQAWVTIERIQFVGACNPPTDPGRKPLSHRLLTFLKYLLSYKIIL